ncbi:MAG: hypothetical protein ACTSWQ_03155 [Candidatus Thorarchaeota archaeon]
MMKYQPVAKIRYQSDHILNYSVESKNSKPGESHQLHFKTGGIRECSCVGAKWLKVKVDDALRDCRHKKLVTIYPTTSEVYPNELMFEYLLRATSNKTVGLEIIWNNIKCQQPNRYNPANIYCKDCPLYPDVCNIHKMKVPGKRNTLPMVWRLQGHIYKGERKKAAKLLRKIIKEIERRLHG